MEESDIINFNEEDKVRWNLVLMGQRGPRFIKKNIPTESTCTGEAAESHKKSWS